MRIKNLRVGILAAAGFAASLGVTAGALGQVSLYGPKVIVTRFDSSSMPSQVPGLSAAELQAASDAEVVISWSNPARNSPGISTVPAIDNAGNVVFYGQINAPINGPAPTFTPIITTGNQNAVFYSSAASNYGFADIKIIARDGPAGPTPSNPNNWVLNSTSGGNGINAGVGISSNGQVFISGQLNGAGATSTTNTAFFTGPSSGLSQAAIRGGVAPGTVGATFNSGLNISAINNPINPLGQVPFISTLTGGDTSTTGPTQNDSGLFVASPTSSILVARRGDTAPGTGGAAFGAFTSNVSPISATGGVLFTHNLSTTQGTPPTTAQDGTLYSTAGGSLQLIAQSGTSVGAALPGATYLTQTSTSSTQHVSITPGSLNGNGKAVYGAKFDATGTITANTNEALMAWDSTNGSRVLYQTGTSAVPGISGTNVQFTSLGFGSNGQTRFNNLNHVVFAGKMAANLTTPVPIVVGTNDAGLWLADAANPSAGTLVVKGGDAAPGTGSTFGNNFFGVIMNNTDTVVFQNTLANGKAGMFAYGPQFGLIQILLAGDTTLMGSAYPVGGFTYNSTGNGNGGTESLNDNNTFTFIATSTGNAAIVVVQIPAPGASGLAMAGLLFTLGRRTRRSSIM